MLILDLEKKAKSVKKGSEHTTNTELVKENSNSNSTTETKKDKNSVDTPNDATEEKSNHNKEKVEETPSTNKETAEQQEKKDNNEENSVESNVQSSETKSEVASSEAEEERKEDTTDVCSTNEDNLIDIEDPDDYLLYLEAILCKIHSRFYAYYDETNQVKVLNEAMVTLFTLRSCPFVDT